MKTSESRNEQNGMDKPTDNGTGDQRTANDKARRLGEKEWMRLAVAKVAAEDWWAKISPGRRVLAMTIASMIEEMTDSKRVEIRLEAGAVRARFIHLLKRPEVGCLSAIILPEAPSGKGWN